MTPPLSPCPVCGKEPRPTRAFSKNTFGYMVECDCVKIFAWPFSKLENAWGLYCLDPKDFIATFMEEDP